MNELSELARIGALGTADAAVENLLACTTPKADPGPQASTLSSG